MYTNTGKNYILLFLSISICNSLVVVAYKGEKNV